MHYTAAVEVWDYYFEKLGCWKNEQNDWIFETQQLIIILSVKVDDHEKDFYIDMGILFKKRHDNRQLEAPVMDNHDIAQGLYNVLRDMGEWEYYLNNLFCYNGDVNTNDEIIANIAEIVSLFKREIIPYISKLDVYIRQVKDFEKAETWVPFLQYFRANPAIDERFNGLLEAYYWMK